MVHNFFVALLASHSFLLHSLYQTPFVRNNIVRHHAMHLHKFPARSAATMLPRFESSLRGIATSNQDTTQAPSSSVFLHPLDDADIPKSGIIDYIGSTVPPDGSRRWSTHHATFMHPTKAQLFQTRFRLWRQLPWKKIKGKAVIKLKLQGSLPLEAPPSGGLPFGGAKNLEPVNSLTEFQTLLTYAAHDPRIKGIYIDLGPLGCGYGKLQEMRRIIDYFKQSGKEIIGFAEIASEKELYLAIGFNEFYVPPDGSLDLRGFSSSATFVRGVFDKIGIEPQVQRIGKYKSFGDTFNRTEISEAQREVISSLLTEASDFWVDSIAEAANRSSAEIRQLWAERNVQTPYDYKQRGLLTGVRYRDQVDVLVANRFSSQTPTLRGRFVRNKGTTAPPSQHIQPGDDAAVNGSSCSEGQSSGANEVASDMKEEGDHVLELNKKDAQSGGGSSSGTDEEEAQAALKEAQMDFSLERDFLRFPRRRSGLSAQQTYAALNDTGSPNQLHSQTNTFRDPATTTTTTICITTKIIAAKAEDTNNTKTTTRASMHTLAHKNNRRCCEVFMH